MLRLFCKALAERINIGMVSLLLHRAAPLGGRRDRDWRSHHRWLPRDRAV